MPTPTPGTRIKDITFEAGLLDPTSGVDSITGVVTLDTATPIRGTASARMAKTTGYVEEVFTGTDDLYVSLRIRVTSFPTGSPRVLMLSNAGTTVGNLILTSTGRLRLRNGSTVIGADSAALTVGAVYQVAIHQRRGTGANAVLEAYLAPAGTTSSVPFARSVTGTWRTAGDRLRVGGTNGNAVDLVVDDIQLASGGMPATPASVPTAFSPATTTATVSLVRSPSPKAAVRPFICPI